MTSGAVSEEKKLPGIPVKASFDRAKLLENLHAVMEEIQRAKPASSKGRYIRGVTVSSTMGPGIHIDPVLARKPEEELVATA